MQRRTSDEASGRTRLGRAIRAGRSDSALAAHRAREPHARGTWLRDVILGGQDGLVNILGISLGLTAANSNHGALIAAGLAAAFTESLSMGAVAYTSTMSEQEHYKAEVAREQQEMRDVPQVEKAEVRDIYAKKGFSGALLDRIVETITANPDVWLSVMMDDELQLQPVETKAVLRTSVIVAIACLIGSLAPLVPFFLFGRTVAVVLAILVSALILFGVGVYSAKTLEGDWRTSGAKMLVIGLAAAGAGFLIGLAFHSSGA